MTNLEAKQEAIKKAYGEYFIHADKNGWIRHLMYCPSDLGIENYDEMDGFWRCKSLQGIEDNNGWSVIPNIHDKEIEKGQYWVMYPNGFIEVAYYDSTMESYKFWKLNFTYYQPIEKPLKPIY